MDHSFFDPSAGGPMHGQPVWAKLVGYLGFPVVVASALLWVFTDQIRSERTVLIEHHDAMKRHETITVQQYANMANIGSAQLRALSQICANGAKTKEDREACATVVIPQFPISVELTTLEH